MSDTDLQNFITKIQGYGDEDRDKLSWKVHSYMTEHVIQDDAKDARYKRRIHPLPPDAPVPAVPEDNGDQWAVWELHSGCGMVHKVTQQTFHARTGFSVDYDNGWDLSDR